MAKYGALHYRSRRQAFTGSRTLPKPVPLVQKMFNGTAPHGIHGGVFIARLQSSLVFGFWRLLFTLPLDVARRSLFQQT
jgi:hypothetical protein